ncbi:hypothetical protein JCM14469_12290 [Desulfatiferula olefinivorans]
MALRLVPMMAIVCLLMTACVHHYHEKQGDLLVVYLKRPEAEAVSFLYSHDGFKPHKAVRVQSDLWQVSVTFANDFVYFYIVDDEVYLPPCRLREKDDFGSENCVFSEML